jgi:hypothetical protein
MVQLNIDNSTTTEPTTTTQTSTGSQSSALNTLTSIFQDFDSKMDTYIKKTPRVPTGQEFLADFENAFNTALSGLINGSTGLGPLESEFARNVLMPQIYSMYIAELGKIAKTGQSPFTTAPGGKSFQTSKSSGVETTAGGNSSSSTGTKTSSGTTTDQDGYVFKQSCSTSVNDSQTESNDVTKNINKFESQTVEEDILVPKVMPLDFMKNLLTAGNIKAAYEGSRRGAGQGRGAGTGTVSARRI